MKVTAQYAKEHFGDILQAADNGEEVEIELSGKQALVLARRPEAVPFKRSTHRILGEGVGEMVVPSWEEWR